MSGAQVLAKARALGIVLSANGARLCYEAPPGRLTPELREALRVHKPAILRELAAEAIPSATFNCAGCEATAAATELEARRLRVASELRDRPDLRAAFDARAVPLTSAAGEPVSVVLAIRHGDTILTGELSMPRERFNLAQFIAVMEGGAPS